MAVDTTNNRVSYSGNGSTKDFSVTFEFLDEADLVVIERDNTTGVETTKALTTDYTVTGGDGATGTVSFVTAPASGKKITIYNDPAITQSVDLLEGDVSPAETKERAWDRLTYICQRLANRIDRAVRLSEGYTATFDPTMPSLITPLTALIFNAAGDGLESGPTADDISNAQTYASNASSSASAAAASASAASTSASAAATSAAAAAAAVTTALAASPSITTPSVTGGTFAHPEVSDYIDLDDQGSDPTAPAASKTRLFSKSDGLWLRRNGASATRVGSGGGGSSLLWRLISNAPAENDPSGTDLGLEILEFNKDDSQEIWAQIQVPADYVAGTQILLKGGKFATTVTSGKVLFKATAYLLQAGTTVIGTYSNSRSSTNAAVTAAGVASRLTSVGDVDLTDTSGQINSVAVAAGDLLLVKLIRDTAGEVSAGGSAAADARFIRFAMIPKFS